jgi:hypothetical protein
MTSPPLDSRYWESIYQLDTPPAYSIGRPQPEYCRTKIRPGLSHEALQFLTWGSVGDVKPPLRGLGPSG